MKLLRRSWLALLFALFAGCAPKQNPEPVQVAQLLPLTGGDKKAAENAQQGLSLAVEAINGEDRRIAGRIVVVRNIDTHDDLELVQAEAVRLMTLNRVVAFISGSESRGAERLVRTAQPYEVPVVVPSDFPPGTGQDDFVTLDVPPARRGEVLAGYVVEKVMPKRVVILTDQRSPIAMAVAAAFMQAGQKAGLPLEEWPFRNDRDQIDFASRLTKIGPATALFAGTTGDLLKLQAQFQELKAAVTLVYGGEEVGVAALQRPGVEVLMGTVFAPEGLTEVGKKFAKLYEERFHEPPTFEAVQAYDAGRLLFDTMHELKNSTPRTVRDKLAQLESFESLTGKLIWKDRKVQRPLFVVQVKDREAKVVQTVAPEEK